MIINRRKVRQLRCSLCFQANCDRKPGHVQFFSWLQTKTRGLLSSKAGEASFLFQRRSVFQPCSFTRQPAMILTAQTDSDYNNNNNNNRSV